jgi:hypothetical protein
MCENEIYHMVQTRNLKNCQAWVMNKRVCDSVGLCGTIITDYIYKFNIVLPNLLNQFTINSIIIIAIIIQILLGVERQ